MQDPGRVWSRDELLDRVWGEDFVGDPRVVDVYVRYLREKLGDDAELAPLAGDGARDGIPVARPDDRPA